MKLFVCGLVSGRTLDPAVQIELGDVKTQVSAEKAREIGLMLIEAAEAGHRRGGGVVVRRTV